jgi:hypothetical protein
MMACVLLTALVAGSRPAIYLSSFNTGKGFKKQYANRKAATCKETIGGAPSSVAPLL